MRVLRVQVETKNPGDSVWLDKAHDNEQNMVGKMKEGVN